MDPRSPLHPIETGFEALKRDLAADDGSFRADLDLRVEKLGHELECAVLADRWAALTALGDVEEAGRVKDRIRGLRREILGIEREIEGLWNQ